MNAITKSMFDKFLVEILKMYFNFVCVLQVNLNEMFHQTGQNMTANCLSDLFTQIYINLTKALYIGKLGLPADVIQFS